MRESISPALLDWYDANARVLPWRVPPRANITPDPYAIWLSEVMLQQTTVAAVRGYFARFTERWPTVAALAAAEDADVMAEWAGLGYYARARNLLACARQVAARGSFPQTAAELRALPGIGPYTSAAIAAIAFGEAATVVDGNVERVVSRLFALQDPLPAAKPALYRLAESLTPQSRAGDYAQAMMDLGATICTPRKPLCALCPLAAFCAAKAQGIAAELPRKAPKPEKPTHRAPIWVVIAPNGAPLLETRPPKGLLGGMLGFPTSEWRKESPAEPPINAEWRQANTLVRHTFTHFHLELEVFSAVSMAEPLRGRYLTGITPDQLPTVMRKAWEAALPDILPQQH